VPNASRDWEASEGLAIPFACGKLNEADTRVRNGVPSGPGHIGKGARGPV
jgi:hypothetical protein